MSRPNLPVVWRDIMFGDLHSSRGSNLAGVAVVVALALGLDYLTDISCW